MTKDEEIRIAEVACLMEENVKTQSPQQQVPIEKDEYPYPNASLPNAHDVKNIENHVVLGMNTPGYKTTADQQDLQIIQPENKSSNAEPPPEVMIMREDDEKNKNPPQVNKNGKPVKEIDMKKYWAATGALCLAMFCQVYLLAGVFTYSGFMAIFLMPELTPESAGSYAGLISALYLIGRSVSAFSWGQIADTIGRKKVFYLSFLIPGLCSIWFALTKSMYMALISRFIMGLGNGLVLAAKTVVSELAEGHDELETRAMGLVMGMWGWAFMVGPVISGFLAEPVKQYPNLAFVRYFKHTLSEYPFLLPNLVSVTLCLLGGLTIHFFVDETLPEKKRKTITEALSEEFGKLQVMIFGDNRNKAELLPLVTSAKNNGRYDASNEESTKKDSTPMISTTQYRENLDPSVNTFGTYALTNSDDGSDDSNQDNESFYSAVSNFPHDFDIHLDDEIEEGHSSDLTKKNELKSNSTMSYLWGVDATREHLIVYWYTCFASILVDEAFPLYCISSTAGLRLEETGIGQILYGSGLVFVIGQYPLYAFLMSRYGIFKTHVVGALCATPMIFILPLSLYLNRHSERGDISWSTYIFLITLLGVKNIGNNVITCSMNIAVNKTVPADYRASLQGLSILGGSVARGLGPACAGVLVSLLLGGIFLAPTIGLVVLFGSVSVLGLYCVFFIAIVLRKYYSEDGWSLKVVQPAKPKHTIELTPVK